MATIVRVHGRDAELTPEGWKTGAAALDALCDSAESFAPFRYDPNPAQAAADRLVDALQGEIVSVDPLIEEELPADAVC